MAEPPFRLLFTGARAATDRTVIVCALADEAAKLQPVEGRRPIVLVHGGSVDRKGNPVGADWIADDIWRGWGRQWPDRFLEPEVHPAKDHSTPLARNDHMVGLGADACCAVASAFASGTGHCARAARAADIPTQDYGWPTERRIARQSAPKPDPQPTLGTTPAG